MNKKRKVIISLIISIIFATYANTIYASTISEDINAIDDLKYPGIKSAIQSLQKNHPNWKFQVEYTGLNFEDVIMNECQGHGKSPINLSPANNSKYTGMWICPICGTKSYDSGWYCASEEAIRYMIDPRNSITENDVFQFLDLSYTDNSTLSTSTTDLKVSESNFEITPEIDCVSLKQRYADAIIKDISGNIIEEGIVPTGASITTNNITYTIIKKGDVTGDGLVNIIDVVDILNYITGKKEFTNESLLAGSLQGNSNPSIIDVVNILNYITGKKEITILATENIDSNSLAIGVKNLANSLPYLDEECINTILNSANENKVNPLYLVARIYQEQGAGTSPLATGSGQNGNYVGLYNIFNINAQGNSKETIIKNALSYAEKKGWTSKSASINGGVEIIAKSYINQKQNTLYYQKFNVVGTTSLYSHQYMQNILAAQNEGTTLRKTYVGIDPNLANTYVFTIPVYEKMPELICVRPNTLINNIINYETKTVCVSSSLKVRTQPSSSSNVITGLSNGAVVKVLRTTPEKIDNYYWSLIVCEATGAYGYVATDYIK